MVIAINKSFNKQKSNVTRNAVGKELIGIENSLNAGSQ